jgi:hypothetical protein
MPLLLVRQRHSPPHALTPPVMGGVAIRRNHVAGVRIIDGDNYASGRFAVFVPGARRSCRQLRTAEAQSRQIRGYPGRNQ